MAVGGAGNEAYDAVIVGAGPAGCATAVALCKAWGETNAVSAPKLLLVDGPVRAQRPAIGETIPPAAAPVLRSLGLLQLIDGGNHLECPGSLSVWGSEQPGYNDFSLTPIGKGYHLNRAKFDADLVRAARDAGVTVKTGWHLRGVEALASGYRLGFDDGGQGGSAPDRSYLNWLEAGFAVDAAGVAGSLSRRLGIARNVFDQVLCLCALYPIEHDTEVPAHTLVQASREGWWYAARLPQGRAIVSLCTDLETLAESALADPAVWYRAFRATDWLAEQCRRQFGPFPAAPGIIHQRPTPSAILSAVIGDYWLAVGDAASSYDSMSSAGIAKALIHGEIAGKALARWLRSRDTDALAHYQERVFEDFNQYMRLHQQLYRSESRFPDSGFWQRRRLLL
ncbi:MAG: NAD(P)/FAD-dependent oxidoreductase [Gammaproteobacteria bacterium]